MVAERCFTMNVSCLRGWAAIAAVAALGGCAMLPDERPQPAVSARTPQYQTEKLIGNWGVASYRTEKDRKRTEAQARAQCKLPYKITKGPTDGVMMYFADDPELHELKLKGASDGKTYLGFEAPPGDWQDREILSFSDNLIVMKFVEPEINDRYGTFIFVRCAK